ncbi:hypothetical protein ACJVDH_21580 [Pedobacter sp. AW1-32]|uniref:hypothetical protein n=1 Tax=Pedobacter sp. AW1-32 TaxID=3383026 RepID=UPI003FED5718
MDFYTQADFFEVDQFFSNFDLDQNHALLEIWSAKLIAESSEPSPILPFDIWNLQDQLRLVLSAAYKISFFLSDDMLSQVSALADVTPVSDLDHFDCLSFAEQSAPIETLKQIFEKKPIDVVLQQLEFYTWEALLNPTLRFAEELHVFESLIKKLMLIGRWIAFSEVLKTRYINPDAYVGSDPMSLNISQRQNPYSVIEQFFHARTLGRYREIMRSWARSASSIGLQINNPGEILYLHESVIKVVHAAYIIGKFRIEYNNKRKYSGQSKYFGDWLSQVRRQQIDDFSATEADFQLVCLERKYREQPLQFLHQTLTLSQMHTIRSGLSQWLEAAMHKEYDLSDADEQYKFSLFDYLEQLFEVLFIMVTGVQLDVRNNVN